LILMGVVKWFASVKLILDVQGPSNMKLMGSRAGPNK
jgi:hypothetical protein